MIQVETLREFESNAFNLSKLECHFQSAQKSSRRCCSRKSCSLSSIYGEKILLLFWFTLVYSSLVVYRLYKDSLSQGCYKTEATLELPLTKTWMSLQIYRFWKLENENHFDNKRSDWTSGRQVFTKWLSLSPFTISALSDHLRVLRFSSGDSLLEILYSSGSRIVKRENIRKSFETLENILRTLPNFH